MIPNGPVTTVEYQPGNGSRYAITLINCTKGEEPHFVVVLLTDGSGTAMTVRASGLNCPLAPNYVREKLKVGLADSVVLAELIAHLTGRGVAVDASNEESYQ
jgi:hypothetical protein